VVILLVVLLWLAAAAPAHAQEAADSSAMLEQAREDALEDTDGETGLVIGDPWGPDAASRGRFRVAGGAWALGLTLAAPAPGLALEAMLAREPGERLLVDDHAARVTWRPSRDFGLALGRVAPDAGAGLLLGPPAATIRSPGRIARSPTLDDAALAPQAPARAASGWDGAWLTARVRGWRLGVLASGTRRDARRVGEAWLPVAGVRHRTAHEDSARGALAERAFAFAVSRGPAWLVVAGARSDLRRVPPPNATAAEQRAARVVREAAGVEAGTLLVMGDAHLSASLALDARGRTRTELLGEFAPRGSNTRGAFVFESESGDYTPLRARPERRPHAHAGAVVRGPLAAGRGTWRLETHVVERRAFAPARLWAGLRVSAPGGAWIELRRDAAPVRTLIAFRSLALAGRLLLAGELRWDRHGLARESWRARIAGPLPLGLMAAGEARLGSGRSGAGWLDAEVPGGVWTQAGSASERARLDLARPGRVTPRVAWIRTRSTTGTRSEARLAVEWAVGDTHLTGEDTNP
jgi:hypothetical protein